MEVLESRMVLTVLSGTPNADLIEVRRPTTNPAALHVTISQGGTVSTDVTIEVFTYNTLEINAGDGADTFMIDDSLADIVVELNGEGNGDTFFICATAGSLDSIDGDVVVDGGDATDALYIDDNGNPLASTYTVTRDSVDRNSSASIFYDGTIDRLNLYGGGPSETYNIESTAAGVATSITGGTGNDFFRDSPTARYFGDIAGSLTVTGGGGGANFLRIYDDSTPDLKTYTVISSSVSSGSATVNYRSLNGSSPVDIYGSVGSSLGAVTYNVESTALDTTVTIYGNGNNDTVNVSPTAMNLDNIRGNVSFVGGCADVIRVNDQRNSRRDSFVVSDSSVSRARSATIY
jgi:hypothetical protein